MATMTSMVLRNTPTRCAYTKKYGVMKERFVKKLEDARTYSQILACINRVKQTILARANKFVTEKDTSLECYLAYHATTIDYKTAVAKYNKLSKQSDIQSLTEKAKFLNTRVFCPEMVPYLYRLFLGHKRALFDYTIDTNDFIYQTLIYIEVINRANSLTQTGWNLSYSLLRLDYLS